MRLSPSSIAIVILLATAHFPNALGNHLQEAGDSPGLRVSVADELREQETTLISEHVALIFEGLVRSIDGTPAEGAVVVSSAGGQTATDEYGTYRLTVQVPLGARSVHLTAVSSSGGNNIANHQVPLPGVSGPVPVAPLQLVHANSCVPSWLPTFGGEPGTSDDINALAIFDDGSGPAIFVAGEFRTAGGVPANFIAKWNGSTWTALGSGLDSRVIALAVFDDGNGERLFAGGSFTTAAGAPARAVAAWDGSSWTTLGSGISGVPSQTSVESFAVFDDGSGAALYVGGLFTDAGGTTATSIAKWDGLSWTVLGASLQNGGSATVVLALEVFDDGTGGKLYAGGNFSIAGGVPTPGIASWDGANWAAVGGDIVQGSIRDLVVFDDGSGDALYAGGLFSILDGISGNVFGSNLAKWDGFSWSALTAELTGGFVRSLTTFDGGNGERLVAGGTFVFAGGAPAKGVAEWDGSSWVPLAGGLTQGTFSGSHALLAFDDGSGSKLYSGGNFRIAGGVLANCIARWDGSSWSELGSGVGNDVSALAVFDDGSGPALYAGGTFKGAGGILSESIAKWNGSNWAPLGGGLNFTPLDMVVFDDGSGPALFVGGSVVTAAVVPTNQIAKWDGSSWTTVGSGMISDSFFLSRVNALELFDDGSGTALFAGGHFANANGVTASNIAKWDGTTWSALGNGLSGTPGGALPPYGDTSSVSSMAVFDDGSGAALYVGGFFMVAGTTAANYIAKWDGSSWAALGSGTDDGIISLAVFNDGAGDALFAGGRFTNAGGVPSSKIAKWDGVSWGALGSGLDNSASSFVGVLAVFDDGTGDALFAGGSFETAGGIAAMKIARWDGATWDPLGSGMNTANTSRVNALVVFDDGGGDALYAGGWFTSAIDSRDSYLAKWGCENTFMTDVCNGDGGDQMGCTDCPCSNNAAPGTTGGCLNSAMTSARLIASGSPSVSLPAFVVTDLRFSLTGAPPMAFTILNSGDAVGPSDPTNICFGMNSGLRSLVFDGLRCAVVNTRRHGGRIADANGDVGLNGAGNPWGGEGSPSAGIAGSGSGAAAGQTRFFQVINRDDPMAQCMRGFNTSQSVEVAFTP